MIPADLTARTEQEREMPLEKTLAKFLIAKKQKTPNNPEYAAFRAECKKRGIEYKICRDGYIELSSGDVFPHYSWAETLDRLETGRLNQ